MRPIIGLAILGLAAGPVAAKDMPGVMSASEAVAVKIAGHGRSGRYEMTVVSTGKSAKATFLNSTDDYKRPDNLTFSIAPVVANMLAKRYGAPPETWFKGKTVTVDGILTEETIVNTFSGRPRDVNRVQRNVRIEHTSQIVAAR